MTQDSRHSKLLAAIREFEARYGELTLPDLRVALRSLARDRELSESLTGVDLDSVRERHDKMLEDMQGLAAARAAERVFGPGTALAAKHGIGPKKG